MPEHKSLVEALIGFHSEAPKLVKDKTAKVKSKRTNTEYSYKYLSLDSLLEAIVPALNNNGLVWSAFPARDEAGNPTLHYQLAHVSGDVISSTMPLLIESNDAQALGSAITYARRYAMTAVLNLAADEDDDGKNATRRAESAPKKPTRIDQGISQALSAKEIAGLRNLYKASGWSVDDLKMNLTAVGVQDVSNMERAIAHLTLEQAHNLNVELFKAVTKATEEAA
jgi:ERF superfamily